MPGFAQAAACSAVVVCLMSYLHPPGGQPVATALHISQHASFTYARPILQPCAGHALRAARPGSGPAGVILLRFFLLPNGISMSPHFLQAMPYELRALEAALLVLVRILQHETAALESTTLPGEA